MIVCLHCGILGNRLERSGLPGHLAVIIEKRLIVRRLGGKGGIWLCGSLHGSLPHGSKRLRRLNRLLRRGLLIAETGLE